jgi:hypothetical protein
LIPAGRWERSPGWLREDGQRVGTHEYIVLPQQPDLYKAIAARFKGAPDAWYATYNGSRFRYLTLGPHRYWIMGIVVNRDEQGRPPEPDGDVVR